MISFFFIEKKLQRYRQRITVWSVNCSVTRDLYPFLMLGNQNMMVHLKMIEITTVEVIMVEVITVGVTMMIKDDIYVTISHRIQIILSFMMI